MDAIIAQWKPQVLLILRMCLDNPATTFQLWTTGALAFLACWWALHRLAITLDLSNLSGGTLILAVVMGLGVTVLAMTGAKMYLTQYFKYIGPMWSLTAVAALAGLLIVAPLLSTSTTRNYFGSLVAWWLSLVAAAAMVMLVSAAFDMVGSGKQSFDRGKSHNRDVEQLLK
jgi:hypothetical protein